MSGSTPAERLRIALDLSETGLQMRRSRFRRELPNITEAQLDEAMKTWLRERPDAPFGDHPGPRSTRDLGLHPR